MSELKKVTEDRNSVQTKLKKAETDAKNALDEGATLQKEKEESPQETTEAPSAQESEETAKFQDELKKASERVDELVAENEKLKTSLEELRRTHQADAEAAAQLKATGEEATSERKSLENQLKESNKALQEAKTSFSKIAAELDITASPDVLLSDGLAQIAGSVRTMKTTHTASSNETSDLKKRLDGAETELKTSKEKLTASEALVASQTAASKKADTLDGLVKKLRGQLTDAESVKKSIESELSSMREKVKTLENDNRLSESKASTDDVNTITSLREDVSRLERELDGAFELLVSSGAVSALDMSTASVQEADTAPTPPENGTTATSPAAKKKSKNKKKKKGPGGASTAEEAAESSPPVDSSTTPEAAALSSSPVPSAIASKLTPEQITKLKARIAGTASHTAFDASIQQLKDKVAEQAARLETLTAEIKDKSSTIDRLHAKLKGEEELREEIEGLKDDLMHIGNEHVGAKDQIKTLQTAKTESEKEHADNIRVIEDRCQKLKDRITGLESDLESHKEGSAKVQAELDTLRSSSGSSGKVLEAQLASATAEKEVLHQRTASLEKDKAVVTKEKDELEQELDPALFVRVHRSAIVNTKQISKLVTQTSGE